MNDAWVAQTKKVKGTWQVEIRRTFPRNGAQILVIVGLDGYNYGNHDTRECPKTYYNPMFHRSTKGYNVRLSSNQALDMTWEDMKELHFLIWEAKLTLEALDSKKPA